MEDVEKELEAAMIGEDAEATEARKDSSKDAEKEDAKEEVTLDDLDVEGASFTILILMC